jgi:ankyrin repeat protein
MAAEEPDDRWTITFRALSAFGPGAVCALLEDAKFDAEALKRRAPRQLCSRGDTLLTRAARLGNMAAAKQLLRLGADLEWPTGETDLSPLQVACHCGHDKLVTFFLKQGASIQRRNNRGLSAVSTAVHTPNVKCLDVLAKHGADLRSRGLARGNTLAQSAASRGNVAALQYLAQKGVNLFERDFRGSTSLDAAAKQRGGQQGPNNATLEF